MANVVVPASIAAAVAATVTGLVWKICAQQQRREPTVHRHGPAIVGTTERLSTPHKDDISIVSYNVLADVFARKLQYAQEQHLDWRDYRFPLFQQQILSWQADIVCLQEVDVVWLSEYLEFAASAGYEVVHQDTRSKQVVCMTLFKTSKFQLWWQDSRSRTLLTAFLFTDSTGASQVIYVANCHLEGSPHKPQERINQLKSSLAALTRHQQSEGLPPSDCHVVIAGDINSGRHEAVYKLLRDGWLPAGYCESHLPQHPVVPESAGDLTQPYLLADVYQSNPLPFTRKVPQLASSLDWIFASTSLTVVALLWPLDPALPADRRLPHSRTGLPNAQHPSDHLPIGVRLRVLPAEVLQETAAPH